jgi:ADP-ribose pyrophosphatase
MGSDGWISKAASKRVGWSRRVCVQGSPVYPGLPQVAVGAIVFHAQRVLLVRRAKPPAAGEWAIPGGRVDLGETLQQAAQRETLEETGVSVRAHEPVFTFDLIERDPDGAVQFHYVVVDLMADYVKGTPQPGGDAADARWVSPAELARLKVSRVTLNFLRERFQFGAGSCRRDGR